MLQIAPIDDRVAYIAFLPPSKTSTIVVSLRVFSGSFSIYASQNDIILPNPSNYTWKSTEFSQDHVMILQNVQQGTWGTRLYLSVYGGHTNGNVMLENKFEITIYDVREPQYLAHDQMILQYVESGAIYVDYRVLNSQAKPDDLEVYVESCEDFPSSAPTIYGSAITEHPRSDNYTYKSQNLNSFVQYLKSDAKLSTQERVFYVSVENRISTARHYGIYATILDDTRPVVSDKRLSGVSEENEIKIRINGAQQARKSSGFFAYELYIREIAVGMYPSNINFDTSCALTKYGVLQDKTEVNVTVSEIIFHVGSFNKKSDFVINVLVRDGYGLTSVYERAYIINGEFHNNWYKVSQFNIIAVVVTLLILVLITVPILYFVIGCIVKRAKGQKGWNVIPHINLWRRCVFKITRGRFGTAYGQLQDDESTMGGYGGL
jgi:hypothetical protein